MYKLQDNIWHTMAMTQGNCFIQNHDEGGRSSVQTWNNAQACKQCLCKFMKYCVNFQDFVAICIENPQKGLCKADFDCVN